MDSAVDAAVESLSGAGEGTTSPAPGGAAPPATTTKPSGSAVTPGAPSAAPAGSPAGASSPAPGTPPAAATVLTGPEEPPEFADPKGQIPVPRVREILANTRTKEAARVTAELVEKTYGVDPDTYRTLELGAHVQAFLKDPVAYWHELGKTLVGAGARLNWQGSAAPTPTPPPVARPATPAAPTSMPEPDMLATDGTPTYSAERMLQAVQFQLAQFEGKLNDRLKPVEGLVSQEETRRIQTEATDWARAKLDEAKTWEGWDTLQKDVHALMLRDARYTVEGAYVKLFKEKYLPGLKARTRQETIDELNRAPESLDSRAHGTGAPTTRGAKRKGVDWDTAITNAIDKASAQ